MDLSSLDTQQKSDEGATMHLAHPVTDEPLWIDEDGQDPKPVEIDLLGVDSHKYTQAAHDQQSKRLKRAGRRGRIDVTGEEIEADQISLLVSCTTGWRNLVVDGETIPFNQMNARKLYARFTWMREQAQAFINDRSNFLGN